MFITSLDVLHFYGTMLSVGLLVGILLFFIIHVIRR